MMISTTSRLKAVLDGGIEGRPDNVVFYATSNRRHLMPRDMIENERGSAINPSEAVEEKVSLSVIALVCGLVSTPVIRTSYPCYDRGAMSRCGYED